MFEINAMDRASGGCEPEVIFTYTRKQAIEDGVLVDLMQDEMAKLVREAGFRIPIVMTSAA